MSEKNEEPTHKRLRDARNKGDILKSAEVTSAAGYLVVVMAMISMFPSLWNRMQRLFELVWSPKVMNGNTETFQDVIAAIGKEVVELVFPIAVIAAAAAFVAGAAQAKMLISAAPLKPKFETLNPVAGMQRMFSTQNLFNLLKMLLKLALIGVTLAWIIADSTDSVMRLMYTVPVEGVYVAAGLLRKLFFTVGGLYVFFAIIDYGIQYFEYMKKMKMSKDEVKREHKDSDGNPQVKAERRRLAHELMNSPPGDGTRKASVLVVNPTHFAVALFYEPGVTDLPIVLEKALDNEALFLRGVARDAGVPIFEYPVLARRLFATTPVSGYVPEELFPAVAEVLLWVQKIKPAQAN